MIHYQQQKQLIKETEALNSLIHVLDFKEIYKTFYQTIVESHSSHVYMQQFLK